ncbi:ribosome biogenesis protein C1orf109 homolog [Malaclemys terrapin pileata]|uniref:ribosome biogenesis protein C1orf109 homolog n=1 Tax=Malaclemys terrapin pileata TaxID=2991368 RepID=UPI0023A8EEE7|nr:ribosome biogenesis protein C1orf109 homolog [Malaclemys terrapin pileata]XP_053867768.1 ribosome biogenesis protein C1orf109 homolog [Malaclemys terrapin pileata]
MSEHSAILVLHQSLQKCFQAIQQQQEAWQTALTDCKPLLSSLSNLAEQMQACQKVTFAHTPLRDFPDLEEQLKYKQHCAAETLLEELGGKVADLQKVRDVVSGYVGTVFQLYEQHADVLGFEALVQRTALIPSLADMLEWLHDIERYYRHVYLESKLLLLQIRYENLPDMQTLPQSWERILEHNSRNMVQDTLLKVSFLETL